MMKLKIVLMMGMICMLFGVNVFADAEQLLQVDAQIAEAKSSQSARAAELNKSFSEGSMTREEYEAKVNQYAADFQKQMAELEKAFHAALGAGDAFGQRAAIPAEVEAETETEASVLEMAQDEEDAPAVTSTKKNSVGEVASEIFKENGKKKKD